MQQLRHTSRTFSHVHNLKAPREAAVHSNARGTRCGVLGCGLSQSGVSAGAFHCGVARHFTSLHLAST